MRKGWFNQEKIHAIHVRDLEKTLDGLGMLIAINDGNVKCYYCKSALAIQDIQSIFMVDGHIEFCCTRTNCLSRLMLVMEGNENE